MTITETPVVTEPTVEGLKADLQRVFDALRQEAIDREWCHEYDRIRDGLVGNLKSVTTTTEDAGSYQTDVTFRFAPSAELVTAGKARVDSDYGKGSGDDSYYVRSGVSSVVKDMGAEALLAILAGNGAEIVAVSSRAKTKPARVVIA